MTVIALPPRKLSASLFMGLCESNFAVVIDDPTRGTIKPTGYHTGHEMQHLLAELADQAQERGLDFEIIDHSTQMQLCIFHNDNNT